jgi:hypothetical protein
VDDTRCKHDMDLASCWECKPKPVAERTMEAQWMGTCPTCQRPIAAGDRIGLVDDEWVCRRCHRV